MNKKKLLVHFFLRFFFSVEKIVRRYLDILILDSKMLKP